ncbi:MAG TPA: glycosyltransferase [Gammaproteobacteria bacterium]|nr:glycosyltransferase [Gammaproteobacteria bacterium]
MDRSQAKVSVIIPTYNRAALVVQTVDSILGQTRPPDEVIVVDDGSPDETANVLSAYGGRIRYLYQRNAGRPTALNRGVAAAAGEYIWIMDDDDLALPDALERHLAFLSDHPEVDFSYSGYYRFTGDHAPTSLPEQDEMACSALEESDFFIRLMIWFQFYMQGMLVPAECYRSVGPFDESLGFGDDYDMILRLARRFRGGRLDSPTFLFREHDGARGPANERRAAEEREAALRRYDKQIMSKLRAELPLVEYLPRGSAGDRLGPAQRREALLQRACIMVRHELFDEAFADISAALAEGGGNELSDREQRLFSHILNVEGWWLERHRQFTARMGAFLRKRGAWTALEACGVGLGWRLAAALRNGQYASALRTTAHLRRLTGTARIPAVARMAVRRRYRQPAIH